MRRSLHLSHATVYHPLWPGTSLRDAIGKSRPDLVVPCDDRAVLQLLALYDEIRTTRPGDDPTIRMIERSLGRPSEYPKMMSRVTFIEQARALGIRAPEIRDLLSENSLREALEDWSFPLVIKRDHSWGGTGVRVVKTCEEAFAVYRKWTKQLSRLQSLGRALRYRDPHLLVFAQLQFVKPSISLQRFVHGSPATTAFACWEGTVLATINTDVLVTERAMGPSCVVRCVQDLEMTMAARRLAQFFGISGLHGLDYIRDTNGDVHLLEINPRATATSYLPLGLGRDLLASLAGRVTAAPLSPRTPIIDNEVIALFPQEIARDAASQYLRTAYHDVPNDDPGVLHNLLQSARGTRARQSLLRLSQYGAAIFKS